MIQTRKILTHASLALVGLSAIGVSGLTLMEMGILAFTLLFMLGTSVGVGVSMDVSGFNLSMAGNKEYNSEPTKHSLFHAFWHSLFLAIGIGLVSSLAQMIQWMMVKFDLMWIFEWVIDILPLLDWLEPLQFPMWIFAIIGVALWVRLYWNKIRGAGEDEHVPGWLKWVLNLLRVPVSQTKYVLVAVDMWFLTPLLQAIISGYSVYGKIVFVIIVFGTVYYCSKKSMEYAQRMLKTENQKVLFFWLVALVLAEPLITGFFAARASWWTVTGEMENYIIFIAVSGACVALLCINKFSDIVEEKWNEAIEAIKLASDKDTESKEDTQ